MTPMNLEKANLDASRISKEVFSRSRATSVASEAFKNSSDTTDGGGPDVAAACPGVQSEKPRARVPRAMIT